MKLSEIITAVRGRLGDDQYNADSITESANWFQEQLFNDTHTRIMESSDTIDAAIGDTTADFPSDMQLMINLYSTSPDVFDLSPRFLSYPDFQNEYANFASAAASNINRWTDFGNALRFSAPLSVAHTFAIDYLRRPVPMARNSDVCEIPDNYRQLITRGTLAMVMEQEEDYDEAANERSIIAPLILTFKKNEGRGLIKTGPVVMRTNRRRGNQEW